jgi:hypothetical protein
MRKIIRLLGFILITLGYIQLLLWFAYTIVPLPRSIFVEMDDKYPPTKMYSHAEVLDAVSSVAIKYKSNSIEVIALASLMLFGGVLLDVSGRFSASQNPKKG